MASDLVCSGVYSRPQRNLVEPTMEHRMVWSALVWSTMTSSLRWTLVCNGAQSATESRSAMESGLRWSLV
eukprot:8898530-Lingulodinium_polyedra.AAC.1